MTSAARPRRSAVTPTQAAAKASAAADAVAAWLQTQSGRIGPHPEASEHASVGNKASQRAGAAGEPRAAPPAVGPEPDMTQAGASPDAVTPAVPADRDPEAGRGSVHPPLRLAHTDWLPHRLLISGPEADLVALRTAACGAGTVPWQLNFDHMQEDLFHLLAAPPASAGPRCAPTRGLSLAGARILSGQLREAAAHRHALATARVGHSRACPFDLHALLPVPDAMLRRGPDDPAALAWLWRHWGTTQALRHVTEDTAAGAALQARAPAGQAVWVLTFWSADWTPWQALAQLAAKWPTLCFDARPTYDGP